MGGQGKSNIVINDNIVNKTLVNDSQYKLDNYVINRNIQSGGIRGDENNKSFDTGTAIAISISCVFVFVFCVIGAISAIKYNKCNCTKCNVKDYHCKTCFTNLTVSKGSNVYSIDEVNQTSVDTINPILSVFQAKNCDCKIKEMYKDNKNIYFIEGVGLIKKAIEKDNEHYYKEAVDLYNAGIENLVKHMKSMANSGERFAFGENGCLFEASATFKQNRSK